MIDQKGLNSICLVKSDHFLFWFVLKRCLRFFFMTYLVNIHFFFSHVFTVTVMEVIMGRILFSIIKKLLNLHSSVSMRGEYDKQMGSVFTQWEIDIQKSKDSEEKLEVLFCQ